MKIVKAILTVDQWQRFDIKKDIVFAMSLNKCERALFTYFEHLDNDRLFQKHFFYRLSIIE